LSNVKNSEHWIGVLKMGGKSKSVKPRSNASWVWKYFVQNGDGKYAKCSLCTESGKGKLKSGGTTANLMNHLKLIHGVYEFGYLPQEAAAASPDSDVVIVDEVRYAAAASLDSHFM
jgi:BED zinc finger